jgi:hypothetical protein
MKRRGYVFALFFFASGLGWISRSAAQFSDAASFSGSLPGGHRGAITAIVRDGGGRILSAGVDGFLEIGNDRNMAAEDRFQLSPYGIEAMVLRPGKPQITVIESDGLGLYRISAWDYETKKNLFTLRFRDSISFINYSAAGSFLIAARSGRTGVVFIHPESGEVLESPEELSGSVAFAATGRSERIMICYLTSGVLSYWNLEKKNEIRRFEAPASIRSPVLFGNNRFFGGFDLSGLLILDAVTGTVLVRDESITQGSLFTDNSDSSQFSCFAAAGSSGMLYRMDADLSGRLTILSRRAVPVAASEITCTSGDAENILLGTARGTLWIMGRSGAQVMNTENPELISDAAVSSSALAFIAEGDVMGYIPLDYSFLGYGDVLNLEDAGGYTNIVSDPSGTGEPYFLLWQSGGARSIPLIKTITGLPGEAFTSQRFLDKFSPRFPLRSVSMLNDLILFLDTTGSISVLNRDSGNIRFSYSAAGSVDAAFLDPRTIILGRSAAMGNTPFMSVNTATGETVPLAYPAVVGVRVYRGSSGAVYGAAINQSGSNIQTSIIRINTSSPAASERLMEYNGEDSLFAMAESGGGLASTLGDGGAILCRTSRNQNGGTPQMINLERSRGLPVKILDGGKWFVILDGEGGITWHDPRTGKLLAVFRIYPDFWVLEAEGKKFQGRTVRK